jgi:hypothetical protein
MSASESFAAGERHEHAIAQGEHGVVFYRALDLAQVEEEEAVGAEGRVVARQGHLGRLLAAAAFHGIGSSLGYLSRWSAPCAR